MIYFFFFVEIPKPKSKQVISELLIYIKIYILKMTLQNYKMKYVIYYVIFNLVFIMTKQFLQYKKNI